MGQMQLGFFLATTADDVALVPRLLQQIELHYPEAEVAVLGDGLDVPPMPCPTARLGSDRLKRSGTIHQYSHRKLALALELLPDADIFVQLDPDTYLQKPFTKWPIDLWAGSFMALPKGRLAKRKFLHGALWMMRRELAQQLVEANPFSPEHYIHEGRDRPDGSAMEDLGFAESVRLIYPAEHWGNWGQLGINAHLGSRWPAIHPLKYPLAAGAGAAAGALGY